MVEELEEAGLSFVGKDETGKRMEVCIFIGSFSYTLFSCLLNVINLFALADYRVTYSSLLRGRSISSRVQIKTRKALCSFPRYYYHSSGFSPRNRINAEKKMLEVSDRYGFAGLIAASCGQLDGLLGPASKLPRSVLVPKVYPNGNSNKTRNHIRKGSFYLNGNGVHALTS